MKEFENKTVLITGGTGSFGIAFLKKIYNSNFKEIRILSRDEKKQHDLRLDFNNPKIKFLIGDIRDLESVELAMKNVDYVFHAAALKHVPSCEFFPIEATKTNILGTNNILSSAIKNKVKKVICLSTDKAAYPINAMGISKALMEKVAISKSREIINDETKICITGYGNVIASRGSVIPLFINQIKLNKPITVTNPNMTRFLMSLEEAIDLVLYAFTYGGQGELFVYKAPSCTIGDLVKSLMNIFKSTCDIKVIGTRHGEKLYETLCTKEEMYNSVDHKNYFMIPSDNRNLNYNNYFSEGNTKELPKEDFNSHNSNILSVKEVENILLKLDYIKNQLS